MGYAERADALREQLRVASSALAKVQGDLTELAGEAPDEDAWDGDPDHVDPAGDLLDIADTVNDALGTISEAQTRLHQFCADYAGSPATAEDHEPFGKGPSDHPADQEVPEVGDDESEDEWDDE